MYCCICGCSNSPHKNKLKNSGLKFYSFPRVNTHMPWLNDKREKWIKAVKNYTRYPNNFLPSKNTIICSAHFIGNRKTENPQHPSYIPTIFPIENQSRLLIQQSPVRKIRALDCSTKQPCRMQQADSVKVDAFEDSCPKLSPEEHSDDLEQRKSPTKSVGSQTILNENEENMWLGNMSNVVVMFSSERMTKH